MHNYIINNTIENYFYCFKYSRSCLCVCVWFAAYNWILKICLNVWSFYGLMTADRCIQYEWVRSTEVYNTFACFKQYKAIFGIKLLNKTLLHHCFKSNNKRTDVYNKYEGERIILFIFFIDIAKNHHALLRICTTFCLQ